MGSRPNFNIEDPRVQETIRRKNHEYVEGGGSHGRYVERPYLHQEYPKVMDRTPFPQLADFKGKPDAEILLENARREWDTLQTASTVKSKAGEEKWLAEHKDDPVVSVVDRQYPKTMDRTAAPQPGDFDSVADFRAAKTAWKVQVQASIVHDSEEEQLWIREHAAPKRGKGKAKAA